MKSRDRNGQFKPLSGSPVTGTFDKRTRRTHYQMIRRCSENADEYTRKYYFDKGIRVCDRWMIYENFVADMGNAPDGFTLGRIDGSKGYCPENCRWETWVQQANNVSRNRIIHFDGQSHTVTEWARIIGIKPNTLEYRIVRGITPERALKPSMGATPAQTKMVSRQRNCLVCGKAFIPRLGQLRAGHGKYCSQECNGKAKTLKCRLAA
ncbi:MAG: hypothetical protein LBE24_04090 [Methylobacillus sp.]|jgi:hypothetical protein|nr:hypothetical protein [Methylobacillus sp.]